MQRWYAPVAGLLVLALAFPAFAGEPQRCTLDIQTCLNQMAARMEHRGYMGLEFNKDDSGQYVVRKVVAHTPAESAGFMPGDVILVVNGARWSDAAAMGKLNWNAGARMAVKVLRGTEKKTLNVRLTHMPPDIIARTIGAHMLENHVTLTSASR